MLVYVKMILKRKKREEEFLKAETGNKSVNWEVVLHL